MTYFENTISQYPNQSIHLVCKQFHRTQDLIWAAKEPFCDGFSLIANGEAIRAAEHYLNSISEELNYSANEDVLVLYQRCSKNIQQIRRLFRQRRIDYDNWFDFFVDMCWLYSSVETSNNKFNKKVSLIKQPVIIRKALRDSLDNLYYSATEIEHDVLCIEEAKKAKSKFFPGMYHFNDPESKGYLEYSLGELEELSKKVADLAVKKMSLFYVLTATAVLADYIWRSER